ncbi:MAG: DNA-3-methyladenine glycosylase I [Bacteroidales bacterium]|nr:DNA-3-methyladenine glycosylase I [Bacteroidales bacterium]
MEKSTNQQIKNQQRIRCSWPKTKLDIAYHDDEWGVPVHDDYKHFEFLVLDGFQAGLSWSTILAKRENFRKAFDNFDFERIANYGDSKVLSLMEDESIIRNRLKIYAAISNAQAFLRVIKEYGKFDNYIWEFVEGKTIQNKWERIEDIPTSTEESDQMSHDLKIRRFKFVGTTICYAYMQATGMVNDHTTDCFRHKELLELYG